MYKMGVCSLSMISVLVGLEALPTPAHLPAHVTLHLGFSQHLDNIIYLCTYIDKLRGFGEHRYGVRYRRYQYSDIDLPLSYLYTVPTYWKIILR